MQKLSIGIFLLSLIAVSASDGSPGDGIEFLKTRMAEIKGEMPFERVSEDLPDPKCGTPVTVAIHGTISRGIYDETLETLAERPDYLPDTLGGENILVHYASTGFHAPYQGYGDTNPANGITDYIDSVLAHFEYVRDLQIGSLGYNTPPTDFGGGGDNRYDVYVENLGVGFYGFTTPEDVVDQFRATSFINIENDFSGTYYRDNPVDGLKVTAAHEFFHAIQFGYDVFEYDFDDPFEPSTFKPWWLEASATWMEDIAYDNIDDYLSYLRFFYGYPWMGLGTFSYNYGDPRAFHPYASCVWPIYLTEKYGVGIIKEIWESCGTIAGYNTLDATNDALLSRSSSLSTGFLEFSVWNFHTGDFADTIDFFSEGYLFPEVDTTTYVSQLAEGPMLIGNIPYPPEHLAANFIVIRSGSELGGVRVDFDGEDLTNASWHVAILGYRQGQSEWIDMRVVPNTGEGFWEWRNWELYENVVIIPTVSGLDPLYNRYTYQGRLEFDSTLYGAAFAIISPNGGELWGMGSSQVIRWATTDTIPSVDIEYSTNGGINWLPIVANAPNNDSLAWTVPNTPSTNCLVMVSDASDGDPWDVSNMSFIIGEPKFKLVSAYPSPFIIEYDGSRMTLAYNLDKDYQENTVSIWILDLSGRQVRQLIIPNPIMGEHRDLFWDGRNDKGEYVASGIYIIHLEAGGKSSTSKIAVVNGFG